MNDPKMGRKRYSRVAAVKDLVVSASTILYRWLKSKRNESVHIVAEFFRHSVLLLILDICIRLFEKALESISKILPESSNWSYLPFDAFRAMVTIADSVVVVLFFLAAIRTVFRFVEILGGKSDEPRR